ncbi:MAG: hypothetical protein NVSMB22_08900 [Chloroflexota bacterium]
MHLCIGDGGKDGERIDWRRRTIGRGAVSRVPDAARLVRVLQLASPLVEQPVKVSRRVPVPCFRVEVERGD